MSPVRAAVLVLPLQQQLSRGWRSSTRPDPAWGRARALRKVLSSSCLQVLKLLELNMDLQVASPLPRVLLALLHALAVSWSGFAEGWDELLAPGMGLAAPLRPREQARTLGVCQPLLSATNSRGFKKFHFKVRRNPPHLDL